MFCFFFVSNFVIHQDNKVLNTKENLTIYLIKNQNLKKHSEITNGIITDYNLNWNFFYEKINYNKQVQLTPDRLNALDFIFRVFFHHR